MSSRAALYFHNGGRWKLILLGCPSEYMQIGSEPGNAGSGTFLGGWEVNGKDWAGIFDA